MFSIYLRSLQLLCWNPQNSAYCVCWWIMPSIGWWPSDSSTYCPICTFLLPKEKKANGSIDLLLPFFIKWLHATYQGLCAFLPARIFVRECPVKKLNTPSTATHCGRICLKRFCFLDAWPRPSLLSKQFSPVNIVLNDSAQRLVTLYLVFTWFERYLNETKQAE